MTPEYKAEKEAWVSHLDGGGIWEINHVTLVAPAAALLWALLQTRQSFFRPYGLPAAVTDFMLHCCVILFAITVYSPSPQILNGLLLLPAIATLLQPQVNTDVPADVVAKSKADAKPQDGKKSDAKGVAGTKDADGKEVKDPLPVKPFITTYRGAMMIITCISILAVDFPVFPRRFAKTESFGTSLMDLGVGSFVFAAGIVAARQHLKEEKSGRPSFSARMQTAMRHSLPLFVLGFIRLWSVKGLEYAEHVSEYGVHWNFFFTLALLPPTIALLQPFLRHMPSLGLVAFAIAISQELVLFMPKDVKVYIILSERDPNDWMSQNREGVFSFAGYLAIFIAGMGIGTGILPRDPEPESTEPDPMDEDADWLAEVMGAPAPEGSAPKPPPPPEEPPQLKPELPQTTHFHLVKWTVIWFVLSVWALWRYGPRLVVSRRMANLAYVVWVCCFNTAQLLCFCSIENLLFGNIYTATDKATEKRRADFATSPILRAFNRNGLALFLLANLLTGAVNMGLETLRMGDVESMTVLVGYTGVITGTALALDRWDISIKL